MLEAVARRMPHEDLLYLGDTARLPYGTKSPETVRRYARRAVGFLLSQGVKAVVVACNTASALALDVIEEMSTVPVVGVVAPGAEAAVAAARGSDLGGVKSAHRGSRDRGDRRVRRVRPRHPRARSGAGRRAYGLPALRAARRGGLDGERGRALGGGALSRGRAPRGRARRRPRVHALSAPDANDRSRAADGHDSRELRRDDGARRRGGPAPAGRAGSRPPTGRRVSS